MANYMGRISSILFHFALSKISEHKLYAHYIFIIYVPPISSCFAINTSLVFSWMQLAAFHVNVYVLSLFGSFIINLFSPFTGYLFATPKPNL